MLYSWALLHRSDMASASMRLQALTEHQSSVALTCISARGIHSGLQVAVLIGEVLGRYFNDWVMNFCIRRNRGVFVAEFRLWYVFLSTIR